MANAVGSGLCRVTVVAPKTRIDLALPEDVPLADLLPTLLRYAGEDLADDGTTKGGWVLARLGGMVLDSTRSAGQLGIRDGEQLYFTPRSTSAPDAVFDDVVDAIATATQERGGRWGPSFTRRFGLGAAIGALVLGLGLLLTAGPPQLPAALGGLGIAVALLVTAAISARAMANSQTGLILALLAIAYAAVGGLLVAAGDHGVGDLRAAHLLIGGGVAVLFAVLAAVAVADYAHVFLAAAICTFGLVIGSTLSLVAGISAAGAGGIIGALALVFTSALPSLSFRLGRLPMPTIPSGPEELRTDAETVDGARVLSQSDAADRQLTGLLGATALLGLGAEFAVAFGGSGWPRLVLLAVLALVLLARSRSFAGGWQRLPLMIAGMVGLGLTAVAGFAAAGSLLRLVAVVPGVLVVAVISLICGLTLPEARVMPVWTKVIDIFEVLLIVAVVPLVLWVCGAYAFIRSVKG